MELSSILFFSYFFSYIGSIFYFKVIKKYPNILVLAITFTFLMTAFIPGIILSSKLLILVGVLNCFGMCGIFLYHLIIMHKNFINEKKNN